MQYNDDINDTIDTKNTIDTIDTAPNQQIVHLNLCGPDTIV